MRAYLVFVIGGTFDQNVFEVHAPSEQEAHGLMGWALIAKTPGNKPQLHVAARVLRPRKSHNDAEVFLVS